MKSKQDVKEMIDCYFDNFPLYLCTFFLWLENKYRKVNVTV